MPTNARYDKARTPFTVSFFLNLRRFLNRENGIDAAIGLQNRAEGLYLGPRIFQSRIALSVFLETRV